MLPPIIQRAKGRPQINRRRGQEEASSSNQRKRSGRVHCTLCKSEGHNRRGCPTNGPNVFPRPAPPLKKRQEHPPTTTTTENSSQPPSTANSSQPLPDITDLNQIITERLTPTKRKKMAVSKLCAGKTKLRYTQ